MDNANVLKIETLTDGWCDNDLIMLHACFQLLKHFVEDEKPFEFVNWNQDDEHIFARKELELLYNWWEQRKQIEESLQMLNNRNHAQNIEDTEMLLRLVKLRTFLWC